MKHTISVLVENKPGVLARIAGLFSARGYNIESLAVGETEDPTVSCMTIFLDAADERILEQIKKQLNKLIDVITVRDLTKSELYSRELLLARIDYSSKEKANLLRIIKKYSVKLLCEKPGYAIVEITGDQEEVKAIIKALNEFGIKELVRTGRIAMAVERKN